MSTTVTKKTYNNKKNYYGKYYSYKKIRNLMNTYFRAKLTCSVNIVIHHTDAQGQVPERWDYMFHIGNADYAAVSLGNLIISCPKWGGYRSLFGYFKCRGIVIEVVPGIQTPAVVVNNVVITPYQGNIAVGLSQDQGEQNYAQIMEDNMKVVFSRTQTVRKYFPFFVKDFSRVPVQDQVIPANVPYNIFIDSADLLANQYGQLFQINFTFYLTFRQSMA